MFKYSIFVCVAAAVQNLDDNRCEEHRSCWAATENKFTNAQKFPLCQSDLDCQEDHLCLKHMWSYNNQIESGQGCVRKGVCAGNGTWQMFEERILQFFCTEEQHTDNADVPPEWDLEPLPEKEWDEFEVICQKDEDCPRQDLGQVCLHFYWDMVKDGSSYQTGEACYNWDDPVCPSDDFSSYNYNYDGSKWSWFTQMRCKDTGSGAFALISSSATLLTLLTVF